MIGSCRLCSHTNGRKEKAIKEVETLAECAIKVGLEIYEKTESIVQFKQTEFEYKIKRVNQFKYLGEIIEEQLKMKMKRSIYIYM